MNPRSLLMVSVSFAIHLRHLAETNTDEGRLRQLL